MSTVPIIEGTIKSEAIDPSKLTHADITNLANKYQEAVGIIDQQRRLLVETNRVILTLQKLIGELRHDQQN